MKILIDHKKLTDSPFDGTNDSIFEFTSSDTADFAQDVINGNPTCYLISGYRGAGKSSFVKKLEKEIKLKDNNTLFIYLNFAKYEDSSIVLRKLIRTFFLAAEESNNFKTLSKQYEADLLKFKDLYERTFYEVSVNTNKRHEEHTISNFRFKANLKDIVIVIAGFLICIATIVGFNVQNWYGWFLSTLPILGIWKFFSYEIERNNIDSNINETSKSLIYDNEIAEHYLIDLLKKFKNILKPIFILDELDKIEDVSAEKLINELKPIMLSGYSSFIVIAGQKLYYNYYSEQAKDDGAMSSIFSKIHHVPLFSSSELRLLFQKIIMSDSQYKEETDLELLDAYIDYLIFESRRIPRRFIGLIRQNLVWENDKAYMEIDNSKDELSIYSKTLKRIEKIEDEVINSEDFQLPIRDYFSMQLMIKAHKILKSQNISFTLNDLLKYNGE